MTRSNLEETARALVAQGKGILAADETVPTITKRFAAKGIESTADSRRTFREMFFTTPGVEAYVGGVILQDETIRQRSASGGPLVDVLEARGIIPGIKVDLGARQLAGAPGEKITEGLDGLRDRLSEYRDLGARFAKWRAVITIGEALPSRRCLVANAHALARYAALCQEQGLVPIVEPEVLRTGDHTLERCAAVTGAALNIVFDALYEAGVFPEGIVLKPSMATAGEDAESEPTVEQVAEATLQMLLRHVPPAVPAIAFLSGGQSAALATAHLNAMNRQHSSLPWILSFSYGRALQDEALAAWAGKDANLERAQRAFHERARCTSAAALGQYGVEMDPAWNASRQQQGEMPWHIQ